MNSPSRYEVRFDDDASPEAAAYVLKGFFTPRELPQALLRLPRTREFILPVGIPLLLAAAGAALRHFAFGGPLALAGTALTAVAVVWLVFGLVHNLRMGRSEGIGVYALTDGDPPQLAGGLRMKVSPTKRSIALAGALTDPAHRGKRLFTALLLGAFRMARTESSQGPVTIVVFAPTHPASRKAVARYVGDARKIPVDTASDAPFSRALAALEKDVGELPDRGVVMAFHLPAEPVLL